MLNTVAVARKLKNQIKRTSAYNWVPFYYGLPRQICIEVTNECNLKCAKCPTYEANRHRGHMSYETFTKILDGIANGRGAAEISFTGGGEPTIFAELPNFIRMASKTRNVKKVRLITNALDLTPELTDKLMISGLVAMNVSLDTTDAKVYAQINRVDGYERVVANIDYLSQAARKAGIPIHLKVTLYKNSPEHVTKMKETFGEKFNTIRFTNMHNWLGLRGKQKKTEKPSGPCVYPFYQVQVLWDGQLTLCCHDAMEGFINMGNINTVDMMDYWLGKDMSKIREAHIKGDLSNYPVCEKCDAHTYEFDQETFSLS